MNDLYRDPLVNVHARIAELFARATALSQQLAVVPQFWDHHGAEKESADELYAQLAAAEKDATEGAVEKTLEREHVLSSLVVLLESLASRIPEHESTLAQIPHGHPPAQPHVPAASVALFFGDKMSEVEWMMQKLTGTMRAIDEHAQVSAEGTLKDARIVKVTLKSAGVPFTYTGALVARAGQYPVLGSHFATYIRRDAAPVEVRPKGILTDLFRVLHITEPAHSGDLDLDAQFALTAGRTEPPLLQSAIVRAALLEISRCEVPTLLVEPGIARLFWSFELTTPTFEPLVRAALRCLREVRRLAGPAGALRRP